mgnify:CR=1 FL=1
MTIKEVSEKFGISRETLRYYERVGIIPRVTRTSGGIRNYTEEDLKWVELAVEMKSLELPVKTMIEYVALSIETDNALQARSIILQNHRLALLEKRKQINRILRLLEQKLTDEVEEMIQ